MPINLNSPLRLKLIKKIVNIDFKDNDPEFKKEMKGAIDYYNQDPKKGYTTKPYTCEELREAFRNI